MVPLSLFCPRSLSDFRFEVQVALFVIMKKPKLAKCREEQEGKASESNIIMETIIILNSDLFSEYNTQIFHLDILNYYIYLKLHFDAKSELCQNIGVAAHAA